MTATRQVQDAALARLTEECAAAGLSKEQTYRIWRIVADAFNRLNAGLS
jgi:hypothetical protein